MIKARSIPNDQSGWRKTAKEIKKEDETFVFMTLRTQLKKMKWVTGKSDLHRRYTPRYRLEGACSKAARHNYMPHIGLCSKI